MGATSTTHSCKVVFELEPTIKLSINYYSNNTLINTVTIIESHKCKSGCCYRCNRWYSHYEWGMLDYVNCCIIKFIEAMKNSTIYCGGSTGFSWYGNIFEHKLKSDDDNSTSYIKFKLTNDERLQFIEELQLLNQIFPLIYCKMRVCESIHKLK